MNRSDRTRNYNNYKSHNKSGVRSRAAERTIIAPADYCETARRRRRPRSFCINARRLRFFFPDPFPRGTRYSAVELKRAISLFSRLTRFPGAMQFHYGLRICIRLYPPSGQRFISVKAFRVSIPKVISCCINVALYISQRQLTFGSNQFIGRHRSLLFRVKYTLHALFRAAITRLSRRSTNLIKSRKVSSNHLQVTYRYRKRVKRYLNKKFHKFELTINIGRFNKSGLPICNYILFIEKNKKVSINIVSKTLINVKNQSK